MEEKPRPIITLGTLFWFVLFFGLVWFGWFTVSYMFIAHESNMIQETCYMYLKNGVPDTIEIENTTYHLNSDYSITDEDRIFLNPYHEMELAQQNCVKVNIQTR
jgi:hypothetical protein